MLQCERRRARGGAGKLGVGGGRTVGRTRGTVDRTPREVLWVILAYWVLFPWTMALCMGVVWVLYVLGLCQEKPEAAWLCMK